MFLTLEDTNNSKLIGLEKVYPTLKEEWGIYSSQIEWRDFSDYQERTIQHSHQGHEIDAHAFTTAPIVQEGQKCRWSIAPLFYNNQQYTRNTNVLPKLRTTMFW